MRALAMLLLIGAVFAAVFFWRAPTRPANSPVTNDEGGGKDGDVVVAAGNGGDFSNDPVTNKTMATLAKKLNAPVVIINQKRDAAVAKEAKRETTGEKLARVIASAMPKFTAKFPTRYDALIRASANAQNISPAVLKQMLIKESSLNPVAVSHAGARGIAQFMRPTWKRQSRLFYGKELDYDDAFNPNLAIPLAARYLRWLLGQTRGEYEPALAAYNGGIGRLQRGDLPSSSWDYANTILTRAGAGQFAP